MRTDAGLIALAAVLGALFCLDSRHVTVVDLAVGVVACSALLVRRRRPVTVAGLLIASTVLSAAGMGATAIAVGAVALYRSWRVTMTVLAVHVAVVVPLFALAAGRTRDFVQGTAVLLALDVAAIATGLLVRSLTERAQEADVRHFLQVEEARHAERERIAREMHDVLAHRISLLAMHAGALEVRRSAPEDERRAAGVVRQSAYEALEDLRAVIRMLREDGTIDDDRPQPTLTDLPELIEQARLTGSEITVDGDLEDLPPVPAPIGRHIYRIVQEGLTNARKHAPGAPVRVRVSGGEPTGGVRGDALVGGLHPDGGGGGGEGLVGGLHPDGGGGGGGAALVGGLQPGGGSGHGAGSEELGLGDDGERGVGGGEGDGEEDRERRSGGYGEGRGEGGADELVVEITNPVPATTDEGMPGAGSGLIGLGERMDIVGGVLEFGPTSGGEFRLRARVPWRL